MQFLFDGEDKVILPQVYRLIKKVKQYFELIKQIDVDANQVDAKDTMAVFDAIMENALAKYPEETADFFAQFWVLDEGETAPNCFVTIPEIISNKKAMNFFTRALPSLVTISKGCLELLTPKK